MDLIVKRGYFTIDHQSLFIAFGLLLLLGFLLGIGFVCLWSSILTDNDMGEIKELIQTQCK